jgi:UDPglucose 6-dehydrogenase
MTITFIGHGYVGLVTACVFADFGNTVWVLGRTPEKLERLKKGGVLLLSFFPVVLSVLVRKLWGT